jgi:signal transduction histidine kinase
MADEIQLAVRDKGTGFDVDEAKKNRGLGLVSMQERVHLVHGSLSVESQPGKGTIVLAVVPLAAQNGSAAEGDLSKEIAGVTEML